MEHKFLIILTDSVKGYEDEVDYLERIYGVEEISDNDIYNMAIDDFVDKIESRKGYFEEYYPNDSIAIAEANVYLEIADKLRK